MLSVFQILATTIIGLIGAYLQYLTYSNLFNRSNKFYKFKSKIWDSYNFFKKRGIKTPDYELLFGNFRQIRKGVTIFINKTFQSPEHWQKINII